MLWGSCTSLARGPSCRGSEILCAHGHLDRRHRRGRWAEVIVDHVHRDHRAARVVVAIGEEGCALVKPHDHPPPPLSRLPRQQRLCVVGLRRCTLQ